MGKKIIEFGIVLRLRYKMLWFNSCKVMLGHMELIFCLRFSALMKAKRLF